MTLLDFNVSQLLLTVILSIIGYSFTILWPIHYHHFWQSATQHPLDHPHNESLIFLLKSLLIHWCFKDWLAFLILLSALLLPTLTDNDSTKFYCLIAIIMTNLLTIGIIDWHHQLIPDECNACTVASVFILYLNDDYLSQSVIGLLLGYLLLYLCRATALLVLKREALGLGDAKLLAALGAWLGPTALTSILLYASLLGILYATVQLVVKKKRTQKLPFGPFLIIAGILVFYGF
ncbi:prepilin peptidase [Marinomonas epiphytica]